MSSPEVLESNIVAIRDNLNELKNDFRAAVARIDNDIKAAVITLQDEIRAMGAKAERDLEKTFGLIEKQLVEMRQDMREMRAEDKSLREKIDTLDRRVDGVDRKIDRIDTKLNVLLWVMSGLGTLITIVVSIGQVLHWFEAAPAP